jgi:hypothetical protein
MRTAILAAVVLALLAVAVSAVAARAGTLVPDTHLWG